MKLTVIAEDNAVYVDGICRMPLDLSQCSIPSDVHALQWKDTAGWVEFKDSLDGTKPQNEPITALPDWANSCVAVYNAWTPPAPVSSKSTTTPAPTTAQPTTTGTKTA